MQQHNRITYRFDRNGNKIDQQHPVVSEDDSTQVLNIEQLEQLIRNSDGNIADNGELQQSFQEKKISTEEMIKATPVDLDSYELDASRPLNDGSQYGSHSDWATPILHDAPLLQDVHISRRERKFSWTNGLVAVLCAVLTGTLLGYLLLVQVFGSLCFWPNSKSTELTITGGAVVDQAAVLPSTADNVPTVSINVSQGQHSYQLLQAGVFSKEDTRDEVIAALQNAGYAAEYTQVNNGKYFVYAAIATSLNNIEPFKTAVSGFELYRKELVLQLPEKVQYHGEATQLESYIQSSNQLIGMYADLVATS